MGDVYTTVNPKDYPMCSWCQEKHKCSAAILEEKSPELCIFQSPVLLADETHSG